MSDNMSPSEFEAKIEWEGGPYDAYEYGLRPSDLDLEWGSLADAWQNFCDAMSEAEFALEQFNAELAEAIDREEELE